MKTEDKTPMESSIEDQKKQALEHYEELSKEGHHWNSFVVKAIKEYIPDAEQIIKEQEEVIEILKRQIHVSGLLYPPSKVLTDMNRLEVLESELAKLKERQ